MSDDNMIITETPSAQTTPKPTPTTTAASSSEPQQDNLNDFSSNIKNYLALTTQHYIQVSPLVENVRKVREDFTKTKKKRDEILKKVKDPLRTQIDNQFVQLLTWALAANTTSTDGAYIWNFDAFYKSLLDARHHLYDALDVESNL